ncbi:MAG TPA: peptide chain release factor 2 [Oligoflexia bacterium]|nr:peptide chain release factor 2 [Oligoflexia bacterium]HMR24117.1 peptide chain release factor 2 [Oligoflexia bacterium]
MKQDLEALQSKIKILAEIFKVNQLKLELKELAQQMSEEGFWDDADKAAKIQQKSSRHETTVRTFDQLQQNIQDAIDFVDMADGDAQMLAEAQSLFKKVEKTVTDLEFKRMLSGEMDASSAILSINSGAGGTESQDWADMLLRMYLRWAEKKGFKANIVDILPGEEAGIKNVTVTIDGEYAYGYLKAEQGIHRLVRISPFDSNARRHTSFASVATVPQVEDDVDIEILEEDLRIDTFRASGAGGQHVNTTDSAVRITHIPTNTVASCQNERSQHKNKAQAMKILKARLYEKQQQEKEKKQAELAGEKKGIDFGSQIRSYTMQPYQLIKDHRTNTESGKVQAVLDGDIDEFIKSYLLQQA